MSEENKNISQSLGDTYDHNSVGGDRGLKGIRKSPSHYLGNASLRGARQMPNEIIQNSVDEGIFKLDFLRRNGVEITPENKFKIYIYIDEDDSVIIKDTGRGVPPDFHPKFNAPTLEILFEELNIGGKGKRFVEKSSSAYQTPTIGKHGMGAACTNACSDYFDVVSNFQRDNKIYHARWEFATKVQPIEEVGESDGDYGTTVSFKPSKELFRMYNERGQIESRFYSFEWIDTLLTEYAYNTHDIEFHLYFKQAGASDFTYKVYDSNVLTIPSRLGASPDEITTLSFSDDEAKFEGQLFLTTKGNLGHHSIVNMLRVIRGSHIESLNKAMEQVELSFYPMIQEIINQENLGVIVDRQTLNALGIPNLSTYVGFYLVLYMEDPDYSGQSKDALDSPILLSSLPEKIYKSFEDSDMTSFKSELLKTFGVRVINAIRDYKYIEKRKEDEEERKELDQLKKKVSAKKKETIKGANDNYEEFMRSRSKNLSKSILYIVEGRTVFTIFKSIRYAQSEALFSLSRRPVNVFNYKMKELTKSTKFNSLFEALSGDQGKANYQAVVLATDYDVDGGLINLYLIAFIAMFFPDYILSGRLLTFESYKYMVTNEDPTKRDSEGNPIVADVISYKTFDEAMAFTKENPEYKVRSYKGTGSIPPQILRAALDNPANYKVLKTDDIDLTLEKIKMQLTNSKYKQQYILDKYSSPQMISIYANINKILKHQNIDFDPNTLDEDFTIERNMDNAMQHSFTLLDVGSNKLAPMAKTIPDADGEEGDEGTFDELGNPEEVLSELREFEEDLEDIDDLEDFDLSDE